MPVNFVLQSESPPQDPTSLGREAARLLRGGHRVLSGAEGAAVFRANARRELPPAGGCRADVTPQELAAVARSLQAWQLGETSEIPHSHCTSRRRWCGGPAAGYNPCRSAA